MGSQAEGRRSKGLRYGVAIAVAAAVAFAVVRRWPHRKPKQDPYWQRFAKAGPQVGERLPDFQLPDTTGRLRGPADLAGPEGLVLVFNQSADW